MSDSDTGTPTGTQNATETGTETVVDNHVSESQADTADFTDWKAAAAKAEAEAEKWRALARKHEGRAKENADAATKARTVEERLAAAEKALSDRDAVDIQRNGRLALAQVKTRLAEAGLSRDDMSGVFELIDPTSLLVDGEPDDKAIDKLAKSLTKVAGRTTPDRDQGQGRGSGGPVSMNDLIRRAAGVTT
jgi:hypothetical protein